MIEYENPTIEEGENRRIFPWEINECLAKHWHVEGDVLMPIATPLPYYWATGNLVATDYVIEGDFSWKDVA